MRRNNEDDRGSMSVELAILLPAFVTLIVLAILFGREAALRTAVDLASHDAARAASLSRSQDEANAAANNAASATLSQFNCEKVTATPYVTTANPGTQGFNIQVGQPAMVVYDVTCTEDLSNLTVFLGLPGTVTIESRFSSPLDTFRLRGAPTASPSPAPSGNS